MSRVLLLMLFLLWMTWLPNRGQGPMLRADVSVALFLGVMAALVVGMGVWSRMLARKLVSGNLHRSLRKFNSGIFWARLVIPVWFAVGLFALGWGQVVVRMLGPLDRWDLQLPGIVLGTLPGLAAWMGLWWSQFPADRALREQSVLLQLDSNLPVHSLPRFWTYFAANLRLQVLFTLVPVLLIVLARDVAAIAFRAAGAWREVPPAAEMSISVAAAAAVFIMAPAILRRVLDTEALPESTLRRRLEELLQRHRLRYRDILLWRTQNNMGNAAVMGILPRVRYVMLSDLLMETMTDEQIAAVFAHEVGHIVHRHMLWYVVFILAMLFAFTGAGTVLEPWLNAMHLPSWLTVDMVLLVLGVATFLLTFGYLSRRFERQADVFAARTMEAEAARMGMVLGGPAVLHAQGAVVSGPGAVNHVGPYGAQLFGSALYRVAVVNNIPTAARSWCHGSIAKRIEYLRQLGEDPARSARFDRGMGWIYASLVLALVLSAGWTVAQAWSEYRTPAPPAPADSAAVVASPGH